MPARKHGETSRRRGEHTRTKEYRTWVHIRGRCNSPTNKAYPYYGARGITVSPEWATFTAFLAAVGRAPTAAHTLERIDNDRGYEPGNVRWATRFEQMQNTRHTWRIEAFEQTHGLWEWSRLFGLSPGAIKHRLLVLKWPSEVALLLETKKKSETTASFEARAAEMLRAHAVRDRRGAA